MSTKGGLGAGGIVAPRCRGWNGVRYPHHPLTLCINKRIMILPPINEYVVMLYSQTIMPIELQDRSLQISK